MRHPLWILNSILLLALAAVLLFLFISRPERPEDVVIEPAAVRLPVRPEMKIDIDRIYEFDLFGTYRKTAPTGKDAISPMPQPPVPQQLQPPPPEKPKFLEPLPLTLTGTFILGDDRKNSAIVMNNKTKEEQTYLIGDKIEDAQILRIFKNKILLLRANGQQEGLYLRQEEAAADALSIYQEDWDKVIKRITSTHYLVDPYLFGQKVNNIAQFIDMLDLTTAYQKGKSLGSHVGDIEPTSLGAALGLEHGDIIVSVDDVAADTTPNRLTIYQAIIEKSAGDHVKVVIRRNNKYVPMDYTLEEFEPEIERDLPEAPTRVRKTAFEVEQEKIRMLKEQYKFAPTAAQIERDQREAMRAFGKRDSKVQSH